MTSFRVSKAIQIWDEPNKDYYEIECYSLLDEHGELSQKIEYVNVSVYELIQRKQKTSFNDSKYDKKYKGHARLPASLLEFIVGN